MILTDSVRITEQDGASSELTSAQTAELVAGRRVSREAIIVVSSAR